MLTVSMDTYFKELSPELDAGMLEAILMVYKIVLLLMLAVSLVFYVLHSVGLYSVARRRGIPRPWLAWLPIGNNWILGSISDRYQFVRNKKRFRNRKKLLARMELATYILEGAIGFSFISLLINTQTLTTIIKVPIWPYPGINIMQYKDQLVTFPPREDDILAAAQLVVALIFVTLLVSLIFMIFRYIAYHDLFASCRPEQKVVFLVLGILFPVTIPFFVFACRKHDLGLQKQPPAAETPGPWDTSKIFVSNPS